MSDAYDQLRRDYQAIEAPANLRARVLARLPEQRRWQRLWLPAAVAATLIATVVLMVWSPKENDAPLTVARLSHTPSVSMLVVAMADRPALSAPSTSGLRSVPLPALPPRPQNPPAPSQAPGSTSQN